MNSQTMTLTPTDAEIEAMARAIVRAEAYPSQPLWTFYVERARAAFAALPPSIQRVPEGWVVAPKEPFEAQLNVDIGRTYHADEPGRLQNARRDIYVAMLAAAPLPPVNGEPET
jgi:hypothetical protein